MQYHLQSEIVEEGKDQPNLWEIESESVCLSFLHLFSAPPSLLPSFVVLLESGSYVLQRCGVVTSSHEKRTVCQQKQSITRQHTKNKSPMWLDPWSSSVVVTLILQWHFSELWSTVVVNTNWNAPFLSDFWWIASQSTKNLKGKAAFQLVFPSHLSKNQESKKPKLRLKNLWLSFLICLKPKKTKLPVTFSLSIGL